MNFSQFCYIFFYNLYFLTFILIFSKRVEFSICNIPSVSSPLYSFSCYKEHNSIWTHFILVYFVYNVSVDQVTQKEISQTLERFFIKYHFYKLKKKHYCVITPFLLKRHFYSLRKINRAVLEHK